MLLLTTPERIIANAEATSPAPLDLETPLGPAQFVQYKPGNFRNQTVRVKLKASGRLHWFTMQDVAYLSPENN